MSDLVLGTAGHVDHGKTTLVRALTGVDLDRLPEEKARGITIALGFVPLRLPGGRVAGLVDVPGHERLVRTMVAGASGLDAALLCVSAAEGAMPQTREHLAVLRILGVPHLVVAQTMADLVDAELLELAADEMRELLADTPWPDAPIVPTSALTGQGLPELLAALDALPTSHRSAASPFRLPVDRAFVRRGFGTVATGTVWGGTLRDGAEVQLLPGGERARVRGIQVHGQAVTEAHAGSRAALNLTGVEIDDVGRGLWVVAPDSMPSPVLVDAQYDHLPDAAVLPGEPGVVVLHGTREVPARVVPFVAEGLLPGERCLVQLHLSEPLPCMPGDRFVVRRASPSATLGGGVILDPWAPLFRKKRAGVAAAELERLAAGEVVVYLERAGTAGLSEGECLQRMGKVMGERIGDRRYAPAVAEGFRQALQETLAERHTLEPLAQAANRKAAHAGALRALDDRAFLNLLESEAAAGRIVLEGGRARLPGWEVKLDAAQASWCASLLARAEAAGFDGAEPPEDFPNRDALLFLLRDRGEVHLVAGRVYAASVLARLRQVVGAWFNDHVQLDPGSFKELTGQSRRTAIPLLEWLDANGVTRRMGDVRVKGS
jgi:selenocysteine-specific elongation factor